MPNQISRRAALGGMAAACLAPVPATSLAAAKAEVVRLFDRLPPSAQRQALEELRAYLAAKP